MRIIESLVVALLVSMCTIPAFAEESSNPGSGNRGFTLGIAYDASYLDYEEYFFGDQVLDKDSGWMNGVNVEARFETRGLWTRALFDYSGTDNAQYDGSTQNGMPVHVSTVEWFTRYEGNIGYKLLDESTATLTPYGGVGHRSWTRGQDILPDYMEKYTWWYGVAGLNGNWRLNRWTVGADLAVMLPFDTRMKTDVAGLFDETTFNIKSKPGFKAEVPVTFDFYRADTGSYKFFALLTPYYQHWRIGQSDLVQLTSGGKPVGISALEPRSTTDTYGANIGIGINF